MVSKDLERFAAALSRLQARAGYNDYQLAQALGMANQIGLTRLKQGRDPRLTTLVRLKDVLGCTLDELCGCEGVTDEPANNTTKIPES